MLQKQQLCPSRALRLVEQQPAVFGYEEVADGNLLGRAVRQGDLQRAEGGAEGSFSEDARERQVSFQ